MTCFSPPIAIMVVMCMHAFKSYAMAIISNYVIYSTFFHHNHSPSGSWSIRQQQAVQGYNMLRSPWFRSFGATRVHQRFAESPVGKGQTQYGESQLMVVGSRSWLLYFLKQFVSTVSALAIGSSIGCSWDRSAKRVLFHQIAFLWKTYSMT